MSNETIDDNLLHVVSDRTLSDNSGGKYMFLDDLEVIVEKCKTMKLHDQRKVKDHLSGIRIIDYKSISSHNINPIRYAAFEFVQMLGLKI